MILAYMESFKVLNVENPQLFLFPARKGQSLVFTT